MRGFLAAGPWLNISWLRTAARHMGAFDSGDGKELAVADSPRGAVRAVATPSSVSPHLPFLLVYPAEARAFAQGAAQPGFCWESRERLAEFPGWAELVTLLSQPPRVTVCAPQGPVSLRCRHVYLVGDCVLKVVRVCTCVRGEGRRGEERKGRRGSWRQAGVRAGRTREEAAPVPQGTAPPHRAGSCFISCAVIGSFCVWVLVLVLPACRPALGM